MSILRLFKDKEHIQRVIFIKEVLLNKLHFIVVRKSFQLFKMLKCHFFSVFNIRNVPGHFQDRLFPMCHA
jgi:hypothetical protein